MQNSLKTIIHTNHNYRGQRSENEAKDFLSECIRWPHLWLTQVYFVIIFPSLFFSNEWVCGVFEKFTWELLACGTLNCEQERAEKEDRVTQYL